MLFDYASGLKRTFDANGNYLPGQITKTGDKVVETYLSLGTEEFEFGQVVKLDSNGQYVKAIEADDTEAVIAGVVVRTFNQISNVIYAANSNQFVYKPAAGSAISVMPSFLLSSFSSNMVKFFVSSFERLT